MLGKEFVLGNAIVLDFIEQTDVQRIIDRAISHRFDVNCRNWTGNTIVLSLYSKPFHSKKDAYLKIVDAADRENWDAEYVKRYSMCPNENENEILGVLICRFCKCYYVKIGEINSSCMRVEFRKCTHISKKLRL